MDYSDPHQGLLRTELATSEMAKEGAGRREAGAGEQLRESGRPTHLMDQRLKVQSIWLGKQTAGVLSPASLVPVEGLPAFTLLAPHCPILTRQDWAAYPLSPSHSSLGHVCLQGAYRYCCQPCGKISGTGSDPTRRI